ncbi:MAG: ribosome biogenesis GTP-binding protein YihA/YsxC [Bacteroidales bacterium]|nr:ribosome biogenesis GTP-binding protein YihA/YsxC [Bacteroidales bacterium]
MIIKSAKFIISSPDVKDCPEADIPEYAFIGRSNVGKSSLINMLSERKSLAKISGAPGKTQLINHFQINKSWYLVDLPGYGFAKRSKEERKKWGEMIHKYLIKRTNLLCTFILIDSRHEPQKSDIEFIEWLGVNRLPFVIVFTKTDKLKKNQLQENINNYKDFLLENWEELPQIFITSAIKNLGKANILNFIEDTNKLLPNSNTNR